MIRSLWRASRSAVASLKRTVASDIGASPTEHAGSKGQGVSASPFYENTRSVVNAAQSRSFLLGSSSVAVLAASCVAGGWVLGYRDGLLHGPNLLQQSSLHRLVSQAAVSVRGWQPWRVAQLEHNPALEAAASPASWVKGPFLGPHFIADAAAKAAPAVVNIMVQVGGDPLSGRCGGSGSGCIIAPDGTILTNAHVVAGVLSEQQRHAGQASPILVTLQDGRTFQAHVKSFDRVSDLAVLEIKDSGPLPVVSLGSSQHLRVGEWIVALGSPLHLSNSVTAGIVSCVDRKAVELGLLGASSEYIQTDAAINRGNSGGPLINLAGEVVGISSMKAIAADGVSFAIPIDTAKDVLRQLREHGRVLRPYAGIRMLQLTQSMLPQLRAQDPAFPSVDCGIIVSEVAPGSPAEKAGLMSGDVITGFADAEEVTTANLIKVLTKHIHKELTVDVKRRWGISKKLKIIASEATAL
ncbi:hypothetical protein WJX84_001258 [Apatococcus fuscideae]|uniref:PDZ domain-containing protein n=1 Tax=Apatococcus fuscideae TaxID=2026836 RepID=A0AAW1TEZ8_9CHLO